MTPEIVKQRVRLHVLDVLDAICDPTASAGNVEVGLEFLIEDWCDFETPKERIGEALDFLLVDEAERQAARATLPILLKAYMDWEWSDKSTWAPNRADYLHVQRLASNFRDCMHRNAAAQAEAVRERSEATK